MFGFGIGEWLLAGLVGMLLFGPAIFKRAIVSMGRSLKTFKTSLTDGQKADQGDDK